MSKQRRFIKSHSSLQEAVSTLALSVSYGKLCAAVSKDPSSKDTQLGVLAAKFGLNPDEYLTKAELAAGSYEISGTPPVLCSRFQVGDLVRAELSAGNFIQARVSATPFLREGSKSFFRSYSVVATPDYLLGSDDDGEYVVDPERLSAWEPPSKEGFTQSVEARILGMEYYTMFKLKTKVLHLERRGKTYEFERGDPLGWRFSSDGKHFRLISPYHGVNIVFSIPASDENLSWLNKQDPRTRQGKNLTKK